MKFEVLLFFVCVVVAPWSPSHGLGFHCAGPHPNTEQRWALLWSAVSSGKELYVTTYELGPKFLETMSDCGCPNWNSWFPESAGHPTFWKSSLFMVSQDGHLQIKAPKINSHFWQCRPTSLRLMACEDRHRCLGPLLMKIVGGQCQLVVNRNIFVTCKHSVQSASGFKYSPCHLCVLHQILKQHCVRLQVLATKVKPTH